MSNLRPILIVPDTHRPYHDEKAWQLMLKVAKRFKPYHLVTIGDFGDFYAVSSHSKDPGRTRHLDKELIDVRHGLDELDRLGAEDKHFIEGNHEDRLTRYLKEKAPELFGVVNTSQLLGLRERGWHFTPYKAHTKIGKLHLTHDVESATRYSTFKALDIYQHSIVTGHAHRMQYIVEGNAVGEFKLSSQFGWLGDASKIDYTHQAHVNKNWALGFGFGYVAKDSGIAYLNPVPIIKYSCVVNGVLFQI